MSFLCKYRYHEVVNRPSRAVARALRGALPAVLLAVFLAVPLAALPAPSPSGAAAEVGGVAVTDDAGRRVQLAAPAGRVITLSPALTEMVFAAGGGDRLVGTVDYSNYPPAALALPRIGDALALQMERILSFEPDLIVAWQRGNNARQLERLAELGVPIYYSHVERLEDIASTLERLGVLLASPAQPAADRFRRRLANLGPPSSQSASPVLPVRVLYQVWSQPLMTVNREHVISDLIGRCGGVNVFARESLLVPVINLEAAIAAAPEAIIASARRSAPDGDDASLAHWRRYGSLPAVAGGFLFQVDGDTISRATPRILEAGEAICEHLEQVRRAR